MPLLLLLSAGVLQVWNVSQPQPLKLLRTGLVALRALAFFEGSQRLLLAGTDGSVSGRCDVCVSMPARGG